MNARCYKQPLLLAPLFPKMFSGYENTQTQHCTQLKEPLFLKVQIRTAR